MAFNCWVRGGDTIAIVLSPVPSSDDVQLSTAHGLQTESSRKHGDKNRRVSSSFSAVPLRFPRPSRKPHIAVGAAQDFT